MASPVMVAPNAGEVGKNGVFSAG